jgi:hypothetical protein
MKNIKLSRKITISSTTTDDKQKKIYNALLTEIKQQYNIGNAQGSNWSHFKEINIPYCNKLNGIISHYASGLFSVANAFNVEIDAKQGVKIKLNYFALSIDEYDFTNATIDLYFQTEQFELLEIFGQSILIKQNSVNSFPQIVDLNDDSISISEYLITE